MLELWVCEDKFGSLNSSVLKTQYYFIINRCYSFEMNNFHTSSRGVIAGSKQAPLCQTDKVYHSNGFCCTYSDMWSHLPYSHRFLCEYMEISNLSFVIFMYWSQLWLERPLVLFPCSFSTGSVILDTKPCQSVHLGWTAEELWGEISIWCREHISLTITWHLCSVVLTTSPNLPHTCRHTICVIVNIVFYKLPKLLFLILKTTLFI